MAKSESADTPFKRFEALAKRLLSVPKKDVDDKEKERPKNGRKRKAS